MEPKNNRSKFMIDAKNLTTRKLNEKVRKAVRDGNKQIAIHNVMGQRYIAAGIQGLIEIDITGIPGNDLGVFMDGPKVVVHGNGQDVIGNTMNAGEIIIHGDVGDITGMSARGGKIYIQGNAGYRTGVHLKEYHGLRPIIVIGGTAQDFLGEYMAGGLILMLGLNLSDGIHNADYVGTKKRDSLLRYLKSKKIYCQIHYPYSLNKLKPFKKYIKNINLRNSEQWSKECISLPMHPNLQVNQVYRVVHEIMKYFKYR